MDYFSELLDSYDKLKKRTFKLRYISEADDKDNKKKSDKKEEDSEDKLSVNQEQQSDGASLAQSFMTTHLAEIQKGTNAKKITLKTGIGVPIQFYMGPPSKSDAVPAKTQTTRVAPEDFAAKPSVDGGDDPQEVEKAEPLKVIKAQSGNFNGEVGIINGTSVSISPALQANPKRFQLFVGKFVADADTGGEDAANKAIGAADALDADKAAEEEAKRIAALREIGGFFKQEGVENPEALRAMMASKKMVDDFCIANDSVETLKRFCKRSWSYFAAGEGSMGLEYKLATATTVRVIDEDGTTKPGGKANAALVAEAARSAAFLTGFLDNATDFKCSIVKQRIGMFQGSKLLLYGNDTTEGIVIGKPNAMHKLALKKIAASKEDGGCGISTEDLSQLSPEVEQDEKAMNAIKGTFYESIMAFSTRLLIAQGNQKKMDEARDLLLATVKKNKKILKKIMERVDNNAGESIELAHELSVQRDLLESMADPGAFFEGVMREIDSVQPFIEFMSPPKGAGFGVIEGGKVSKTGQRADLVFTYTDPKVARAKAKAIGSSVSKKQPDGTYHVPIGLKRLAKLKGTKFGEINNQTRMTNLLTGDLIVDENIEPGFAQSMQTRQYGGPSTPREERQQEYARNLEAEISAATSQLLEDKTYIDGEGKIKSQTPEGVLKQLAKKVTSMLSFEDQSHAIISKAFFTINENGENVLKEFKGDGSNAFSNREYAREGVSRCARYNMLKNDSEGVPRSEDDTPEDIEQRQMAAQDYMIKSALICGSNANNLAQVIVTDSGEMLDIKHNELFDKICNAQNDPDSDEPTFKFKAGGASVTICVDGLCLSVGQEGNDAAGDTRDTRTSTFISKRTLEDPRIQGDIPQVARPQNNSSFEEYVKGHIQLLETFLS